MIFQSQLGKLYGFGRHEEDQGQEHYIRKVWVIRSCLKNFTRSASRKSLVYDFRSALKARRGGRVDSCKGKLLFRIRYDIV